MPDIFAESWTWPDNPRQPSPEHFVNVPREREKFTTGKCQVSSQCLFAAVDEEMKVLSGPRNYSPKLAALRFRRHWIGDLHQPPCVLRGQSGRS